MVQLVKFASSVAAAIFQVPPDVFLSISPMMAPIPKSPEEITHRKRVDELLCDEKIWGKGAGYENEEGRRAVDVQLTEKDIEKYQPKPSTYGEVTSLGARQLFYYMGMTDDFNNKDSIVFFDLGSGVGRLVMQAYMELPRISQSIGIELAPLRHQDAVHAWEQLQPLAEETRRKIPTEQDIIPTAKLDLVEGDFLEADLSEATHIYISSLCFTEDMMYKIAKKIESDAPNVQCVATLKSFPSQFEKKGIKDRINFEVVNKAFGRLIDRTEFVEMSWTVHSNTGNTVHFYTRPDKLKV